MAFGSRLAWGYLLTVAGGWLLAETVGETRWPALLLAYAPALLWLLPAPAVLAWTLWRCRSGQCKSRRRKLGPRKLGRCSGVAVALAGTLLAAWGAGLLHWRSQAPGPLRVLTYNVARGGKGPAARLATTLRAADADIVLLQESNFLRADDLSTVRAALPGYRMVRAAEVMTLTRLPLLSSEWHDLPANRREVLVTRLRWQGQPLSVVNVHLGTVTVSSLLEGDFARLQRTRTARQGQVRVLDRIAKAEAGRVLLGSDLNTPPRGRIYRHLKATFGPDAHEVAGRGPGWTFPSLYLRIDHVMARSLNATRSRVLEVPGSDHRPLLVEYRLPP